MTHAQYMAKYGTPVDQGTGQPSLPPEDGSFWSSGASNRASLVAGIKSLFNIVTGSEQNAGGEIASGLPASVTGESMLNKANQDLASSDIAFIKAIKAKQAANQPITASQKAMYDHILQSNSSVGTQTDLLPHAADTTGEALGNVGGVAADILTAGSYGAGGRAAEQVGKETVAQIAKKTAIRSATGAGVGYGYDVAGNLQQGKTGAAAFAPGAGTAAGALIPALIGGMRVGVSLSKDQAPRFINSLIKPKTADFSYGKDPGRTVAELGITGNSLPDFEKNITGAKQSIGKQLGAVYSNPANAGVRIDASGDLGKIDAAISEAAKGGKNNQTIVNQLHNIKDAILYEHGVDANGVITRVGDTPRDLTSLSPQEAQDLIQHVADQTQFTGRPSDDKAVNATLKSIYGGIREKINAGVGANNPEVRDLNQKYADLTSAEIATRNRDSIVKRSNLVSLPASGAAIAGAITTAIVTGGAAIPAILGGATALGVEKAFESTAVKSRVAAWLGKQTPGALTTFLRAHPNIAPVLTRAFPALVSKATH